MRTDKNPVSAKGVAHARTGAASRGRPSSPAAGAFRDWMQRQALPFWLEKGWDARQGGFVEQISLSGQPDHQAQRRMRVQWRQIYVFAHASLLGWSDGLKLAFKGLEHVLEHGWSPDGRPGFVHRLNADGSVASPKRDSYDHAFALLALAWLARASDDAQVHALLELVLAFVREEMSDAQGFLIEALPPELPRRQNPHMHMLEAMLALHETIAHAEAPALIRHYRGMLEKVFLDKKTSMLIEYFDAGWQPLIEDGASLAEPGHMAEWVWLIRKYERLMALKPSPVGTHFLGVALRAVEPRHGFLIDEIDTLGRPRKTTRRLWPQTELIKAWLAQAENGTDRAGEAADMLISTLMETYLSGPFSGGWHDQYDADGQPIGEWVSASSLYHLFVAATEADRVIG